MRRNHATVIVGVCGLLLHGCNSSDEDKPHEWEPPHLVVPVDDRPPIYSEVTPPPISGGTLLVTSDGTAAVVSDPDRDRVSIATLLNRFDVRVHTIALEPGDQPGRVVEDSNARVHIALRGSGAIIAIDVVNGVVLHRRAVCKAARGIAFDAVCGMLHVACAEGKVVTLPADGGDVVRTVPLPPDLRDVVVHGTELWVTRFKSAEVLRVDAEGSVFQTVQLGTRAGRMARRAGDGGVEFSDGPATFQPGVARRMVVTSAGETVIVHQDAAQEEVELTEPSTTTLSAGTSYGGSGICNGIVQNGVAVIAADGTLKSRRAFPGPPLPVDVAVAPGLDKVAIAHAGTPDPEAPRPFLRFTGDSKPGVAGPSTSITILPLEAAGLDDGGDACSGVINAMVTEGQVVAVAFRPNGDLFAQVREPPGLLIGSPISQAPLLIPLPGDSRLDTGHEIFHRDAGGGIACASCHPEGGEDGHVWQFAGIGKRRTQALHVGLGATAPFHWDGALVDVGALMTEVFVGRMGGVPQSPERLGALSGWLFGLGRPPPLRDVNDEAVARGAALFHSAETDCSRCHAGEHLTNNQNAWVGTTPIDTPLQVPSLVAIGYRAPFLHDGCAATLAERFDPACGGAEHGRTAQLTSGQISDLVAYLESL